MFMLLNSHTIIRIAMAKIIEFVYIFKTISQVRYI